MFLEIRLATNHREPMPFEKFYINVDHISAASIVNGKFIMVLNGRKEIVHPEDVRDLLKAMGFTGVKLKGELQEVKE